jgi:hypothetical protein
MVRPGGARQVGTPAGQAAAREVALVAALAAPVALAARLRRPR